MIPLNGQALLAASATGGWFDRMIVLPGKLPLAILLLMFVSTFIFIRFSVRMIRAGVSWWPGNITPGGKHIHHMVFGVVFMIAAGFGVFSPIGGHTPWPEIFAGLFGTGTALVLDEFALILDLKDVYWSEQGRISVDAVVIGVAVCALMLLGATPLGLTDNFRGWQVVAGLVLFHGAFALVTMVKGKVWTGLFALFVPILGVVGAVRLAQPQSPWARARYPAGSAKAIRAQRREREVRWFDRLRNDLYNAIAGRPSQ
ncbi:hypothetical protein [Nocardia sp. NBC_01327]|uniref:hypothetical protein n=1 Tax=Nocardia sp. NBC_01327 TaxID=2903593 RepID=UPI002E15DF3B|nr:hypothetical protein OG326_29490 [Nocardia sp. NBC_01327]